MPAALPPEARVPSLKRERPPHTHSLEERDRKAPRQPDFDEQPKLDKSPKQGSMPAAGSSRATEPRLGCVAVRSVPPPRRVSPRDQALARLAAMRNKSLNLGGKLPSLLTGEMRDEVVNFIHETVASFLDVPPPAHEHSNVTYLAVTYLDSYLSKASKSESGVFLEKKTKSSMMIWASACIVLAFKFSQAEVPSFNDLCHVIWEKIGRPKFYKADNLVPSLEERERRVWKTLEFKLAIVSPCDALQQIKEALELHENKYENKLTMREIWNGAYGKLACSLKDVEMHHKFAPVTIAASSLIAACHNLGQEKLWKDVLPQLRDVICEVSDSHLDDCTRCFTGVSLNQPDETEDVPNTLLAPSTVANSGKTGRPTDCKPPHLVPLLEEESDPDESEEEEDEVQRDDNAETDLEADDESLDMDMDTSDEDEYEYEDEDEDEYEDEDEVTPSQSPRF